LVVVGKGRRGHAMRKIITSALLCALLSSTACATAPENVEASYVSPVEFSNLSCDQIRVELTRIADRVRVVSGQQQQKHTTDAVALTVGLVVFWPALFLMVGGDKRAELSDLKGQYEALDRAALERNCGVAAELHAGAGDNNFHGMQGGSTARQ
jgi:hypothetical protein